MPHEALERLRTEELTAEDWADYRKLILTALTDLKDSQARTTERLAQNQQLTAERLAENQRAMVEMIADGLKSIGEKIHSLMELRIRIAMLTGMVGAAVIAGLVELMFRIFRMK